MKFVKAERKRLDKKTLVVIIMTAVLVLLISSIFIVKAIIDKVTAPDTPTYTPPEIIEGEAILNDFYVLAYPQLQSTDIRTVTIKTESGEYGLMRPESGGDFYILYTPEGSDEMQIYYPPIVEAEGSFDYSSLFSTDGNTYGMTNVYYLCSVLGTMYFDQRIELPADTAEREETFRYYGFTEDSVKRISFSYKEKDGTVKTRTVTVGDRMITDSGYYYMIDDRPYIYVTTSNLLDYALGGAATLINSMLVAKGVPTDSYLEPYLTPEYRQWKTMLYKNEGDEVAAGSNVIITAEILSPQNPKPESDPKDFTADGYVGHGFGKTEFDLSKYSAAEYAALINALVGRGVGSYENAPIVFTIVGAGLAANIPEGEASVTYNYSVSAIEAILDKGENATLGAAVGANKLLKITYTATVGGKSVTAAPYHAVIDLNSPLVPDSAKTAFAAASVGTLSDTIDFSVTYSRSDAENQSISQLVITKLLKVYDDKGDEVDTVADNCIVSYSYVVKVGGKTSEEYQGYVDLSEDGDAVDELRELLIGKKTGVDLNLVVSEYVEYPEVMADFDTVTVKEIHGFVVSELVVSFRFVNEDLRDPFYGESIYENTLPTNNRNYALNNTVCETVVKILGGIGDTAGTSVGLSGGETVAIGLNVETMLKYGFYAEEAYRIRFVLPRDIDDTSGADDPSYYVWADTLPFTLYISAEMENEDGTKYRYIASDMYDVVTKISAEKLVFLNYDFVGFWARRTPMLLDVNEITSFKIDFNMEDVYGSYDFSLTHTDYYYDVNGNRYNTPAEGRTHDNFIKLFLTVGAGSMDTAVSDYIADRGISGAVELSKFYDATLGGGKEAWVEYDTADVAHFKNVIQKIYFTNYLDILTKEEQQAGAVLDPIMTIELALKAKSDIYVYEFRSIDERRIMVTLTCKSEGGTVRSVTSDFYISRAAMREIVTGFVYVLNGLEVDPDESYQPMPDGFVED